MPDCMDCMTTAMQLPGKPRRGWGVVGLLSSLGGFMGEFLGLQGPLNRCKAGRGLFGGPDVFIGDCADSSPHQVRVGRV